MRRWSYFIAMACLLTLTARLADAQPQCQIYLANHLGTTRGVALDLEGQADSAGVCPLSSVIIVLTVGDGTAIHFVSVNQPWQTGVIYTAKAVITAAGPQQLLLNGQPIGTTQSAFKPAQQTFYGSLVPDSGQGSAAYVVTQISLQASSGSNTLSLAPNGNDTIPLPLVLMAGPVPWPATFTEDPAQTTTITATFRIDAAVSKPHQFDPYIDAYGQAVYGAWQSKVASDSDLQAAVTEEQTWLADNGPLGGRDIYGGSTVANWTDQATGYYHTAFHNNRWWLISPLGNSLFYIGLTGVYTNSTPITGRESMFAQLPSQTGAFAAAFSQNAWGDSQNTTYVSFDVANQVRKYGSTWKDVQDNLALQRIFSWGFTGGGKETHLSGLAVNPILKHDDVPNVAPGGHPDIFDPNIVNRLKASLTAQIGSDVTNPYIIGWGVGNEKKEIVQTSEVQAILAMGASVPAKKALLDHALSAIYLGSVSALATAWKITASPVADLYAAKPTPPSQDLETLRQYYEQNYYSTLYQTVKGIDPNHLYFGSWILPGYPVDWPIAAANCDVLGFDSFSPVFPGSQELDTLIRTANKPVMIGAFSLPSAYGGTRGFGWSQYAQAITLTDSASGDAYTQWLQNSSANPYMVGVEWFEYRDEPASGRGNTDGVGNVSTSLVLGEDYAFGLVDVTDRPKYDLVNKVRTANIAALQTLGLLGSAPVLTSAPANGATYLTGGLVPGSWAQVKGTNLADPGVARIWQNSDFAGLGNRLPTDLNGVQVLVNGTVAAVYYVSPTQVNFQVPAGIAGTAAVQVMRDGIVSNTMTAQAVSSAPGIVPIIVGSKNYAGGVFLDGKYVGDPSIGSSFRNAVPGDTVQLYATGLVPSAAGTVVSTTTPVNGVTVTIGTVTFPATAAALVGVGEFQINFTVPQGFASMPAGEYPISISVNGVSSPATINSSLPGPVVIPVQPHP